VKCILEKWIGMASGQWIAVVSTVMNILVFMLLSEQHRLVDFIK